MLLESALTKTLTISQLLSAHQDNYSTAILLAVILQKNTILAASICHCDDKASKHSQVTTLFQCLLDITAYKVPIKPDAAFYV